MVAERVAELLLRRGLTLAVAESCTGGLISDLVTNVPGSSGYFLAGVVTYNDASKISLLGVRESTLTERGAVSMDVAVEMALGIRELAGSDIGLAATGIAGPGGGTEEKPVGLVHFALTLEGRTATSTKVFSGSRLEVKRRASEHALGMVLDALS